MKRCILHLGMPKTASTSIQATLAENRSLLKTYGWEYPEFKCPQHGYVFALHNEPLCRLFFPANPFHVQRDVQNKVIDLDIQRKELTRVLERYCQNSSRLILSSEALLRPLPLKRIKKFLESRGYEVEPIVYVRAPYSHRVSLFQSLLKFSLFTEQAILEHLQEPIVRPAVKAAMKVFPDTVRLYPFTHFSRNGTDVVRHFFAHFLSGSEFDSLTVKEENRSLSWQATALLGYIEDHCPLYDEFIKNPLRKPGDIRPIHQLEGDTFHITSEQLALFQEIIDIENTWLRQNLGPEYCDPDYTSKTATGPMKWKDESVSSLLAIFSRLPVRIQIFVCEYLEGEADFASVELKEKTLGHIRKEIRKSKIFFFKSHLPDLFPAETGRGRLLRKIYRTLTG